VSLRDANARFCPRCGLEESAILENKEPLKLAIGGEKIVVRDLLALGDVCNLYRCTIQSTRRDALFKIARTELANRHVAREWQTLALLHEADSDGRAAPFLPRPVASVNYMQTNGEPARSASVLSYHEGIAGPDDLYTLEEVRAAHPAGVDARDMAWMWRRLLSILGFVHAQRLVHGNVTPDHVLIEPAGHRLLLIGWCGAVSFGSAPVLMPQRWRDWGKWGVDASATTDLSSAARTMSYLMGSNIEPAIARHLERAAEASSGAGKLLEDFDRMIEALWGPRQFRTFKMPARRKK
jgi:hypothetical protein